MFSALGMVNIKIALIFLAAHADSITNFANKGITPPEELSNLSSKFKFLQAIVFICIFSPFEESFYSLEQ